MHYPVALSNGTIINDDYRIEEALGSGGTGITYVATELPLDRKVAIKEYFPSDIATRAENLEVCPKSKSEQKDYTWGLDRFVEEAQTLAKFDHANIVRVFRYFKLNNTAYMVLKFEEGQDFKSWFSKLGRSPSQTELELIISPLLDAMELIHENNFLHRDISPDNIIIRKNGSPVLIDFGSARKFLMHRSRTVSALVKPGYSPYEQYAMNAKNQGPWTDIYSMGATLYHAVTGQRPVDSPSRMVEDEMEKTKKVAPEHYKNSFLNAIDFSLKLKIKDRPQNVKEWRKQLFSVDKITTPAKVKKPARKITVPTQEYDFQLTRLSEVYANWPKPKGIIRKIRRSLYRNFIRLLAYSMRFDQDRNLRKAESLLERLDDISEKESQQKTLEEQLKEKQKQEAIKAKKAKDAVKRPSIKEELDAIEKEEQQQKELDENNAENNKPKFVTINLKRSNLPVRTGPITQARARIRGLQETDSNKKKFSKLSLTLRALQVGMIGIIVFSLVYIADFYKVKQAYQESQNNKALIHVLNDHNGPVNVAIYSGDGDRIISASEDKTIKIWDSFSGKLDNTLYGHYDNIVSLNIYKSYLVSADASGTIILWSLKNLKKLKKIETKNEHLKNVYFAGSHNSLVLVHKDRIQLINHKQSLKPKYRILTGNINISATDFSNKRNLLAAAGTDKSVKLWRAKNGSLLRSYKIESNTIDQVSFTPDSQRLAVVSKGDLHIWSARSKKKFQKISAHKEKILSIAFSPNGRLIATAGKDNKVKLWNRKTGELLKGFKSNQNFINHMSFSPDSRILLSSSKDRTLKLWNIHNIKQTNF